MPKRKASKIKKENAAAGGNDDDKKDEDEAVSVEAVSVEAYELFGEEVVGRSVMILFDMEGTRNRVPYMGTVITYAVNLVEEEPPEPRKLPARKGKKSDTAETVRPVNNKPHNKPAQFTDQISRLHRVAFDDGDEKWLDLSNLKMEGRLWWQDADGPVAKRAKGKDEDDGAMEESSSTPQTPGSLAAQKNDSSNSNSNDMFNNMMQNMMSPEMMQQMMQQMWGPWYAQPQQQQQQQQQAMMGNNIIPNNMQPLQQPYPMPPQMMASPATTATATPSPMRRTTPLAPATTTTSPGGATSPARAMGTTPVAVPAPPTAMSPIRRSSGGEFYGGLDFSDIPKDLPLIPAGPKSKAPYKGVQYVTGKWRTKIEIQGRQIPLGSFATAEEAAAVYARAEYYRQRLKTTGGSLPDSVKGAVKKTPAEKAAEKGAAPGAASEALARARLTNPNATHVKPKKPLSANSYFFKEQREKIIKLLNGLEVEDNEPGSDDYIFPESIEQLRSDDGTIKYDEVARLIGERWKTITDSSLVKYNRLAAVDLKRYQEELKNYVPLPEGLKKAKAAKKTAGGTGKAGDGDNEVTRAKRPRVKLDIPFLEDMRTWLERVPHGKSEGKLRVASQSNAQAVVRGLAKLARGEGVANKHWPNPFYAGIKVDLVTCDVEKLVQDARDFEAQYGDTSGGWLLRHPMEKFTMFRKFKSENPNWTAADAPAAPPPAPPKSPPKVKNTATTDKNKSPAEASPTSKAADAATAPSPAKATTKTPPKRPSAHSKSPAAAANARKALPTTTARASSSQQPSITVTDAALRAATSHASTHNWDNDTTRRMAAAVATAMNNSATATTVNDLMYPTQQPTYGGLTAAAPSTAESVYYTLLQQQQQQQQEQQQEQHANQYGLGGQGNYSTGGSSYPHSGYWNGDLV